MLHLSRDRTLRDLHLREDLVRVARGVYLPRPSPQTPGWQVRQDITLGRCLAVSRPGLVISHEAAAIALGLSTLSSEPDIDLTVAPGGAARARRLPPVVLDRADRAGQRAVTVRRHRRRLDRAEVVRVGALTVSSPLRTAADCAFDLPVYRSLPVIDSALRAVTRPDRRTRRMGGVMTLAQAHAALDAIVAAQGSRRGVVRARAAVALGDPFAESPGESVLRWAAAAGGLPAPVSQLELWAEEWYYLDLAFRACRIAWEFDGLSKFSSREDVRAEKRRELRIQRAGWRVVRFGWEDVMQPERLVQRARESLGLCMELGARRRDLLV